jgi:hypothetical protein
MLDEEAKGGSDARTSKSHYRRLGLD